MQLSDFSSIEHFDIGYGALWGKEDSEHVKNDFDRIRSESENIRDCISWIRKHPEDKELIKRNIDNAKARRTKLLDNFEHKLERTYNDKTVKDFEPLYVTKKVDKVVNTGFTRIAELVVGESVEFFNTYACGTGTTTAYVGDTTLETEIARVAIDTSGYATASGAIIKYGAYFATGVPSASISESGVFDNSVSGAMLFRTVYPASKVIVHTQNSTFFTLSHAIYQSSV